MTTANHILSQEGILTTFSIAKKVTDKDIKKLHDKMKSSNIDVKKIEEFLKQSVIEDVATSMKKSQIPGLIVDGQSNGVDNSEEDKKIMELTYFSSLIAKKITEKKMDKYYACYVINALVNMLGLNDDDFEQFHKRFGKYKNGGKEPEEEGGEPSNF
jgi:predicted TIM-barrel enzyme